MKEKNQNFFFELNLEGDHCIKHAFWAEARSKAVCEYFRDVVSFDTTYNINRAPIPSNGDRVQILSNGDRAWIPTNGNKVQQRDCAWIVARVVVRPACSELLFENWSEIVMPR
ncbi:hypothetical protein Ahy_B03g063970 [Arachis hypogaea]|uniref:Protein FAR1-RELATED SEQUENCE n=1 Tax=Arachis hypogaea TaxID=3818 RepID=A0A444ZYE5_ARAHY|nr:hypothetical protein Ahy_B03g063970 [Arachis hypogaea]